LLQKFEVIVESFDVRQIISVWAPNENSVEDRFTNALCSTFPSWSIVQNVPPGNATRRVGIPFESFPIVIEPI